MLQINQFWLHSKFEKLILFKIEYEKFPKPLSAIPIIIPHQKRIWLLQHLEMLLKPEVLSIFLRSYSSNNILDVLKNTRW